jgi:nudix-type nucleoside diphosphatase (YffH/AdpP family)
VHLKLTVAEPSSSLHRIQAEAWLDKVIVEKKARILDDFFKVDEAHLRFEKFNGQMSRLVRRLNFERGDSVAALIFNPETRKLILVNQFRYPTCEKGPGWICEVVAGALEKDEEPEAAVRREAIEETGYSPTKLEHISTFYVSPGGSSERIILYYAEVSDKDKVGPGGGVATESEDIQLVTLTLDDALAQIADGRIIDAKTIVGLYWLQNKVNGAPG